MMPTLFSPGLAVLNQAYRQNASKNHVQVDRGDGDQAMPDQASTGGSAADHPLTRQPAPGGSAADGAGQPPPHRPASGGTAVDDEDQPRPRRPASGGTAADDEDQPPPRRPASGRTAADDEDQPPPRRPASGGTAADDEDQPPPRRPAPGGTHNEGWGGSTATTSQNPGLTTSLTSRPLVATLLSSAVGQGGGCHHVPGAQLSRHRDSTDRFQRKVPRVEASVMKSFPKIWEAVHVAAFQAQPEEGEEWLKKVHREGLSLMQGLMADPEQCPLPLARPAARPRPCQELCRLGPGEVHLHGACHGQAQR